MLDATNLFERAKATGNVHAYHRYKKFLETEGYDSIKVSDLPVMSKLTGLTVDELLGLHSEDDVEIQSRIIVIKAHIRQARKLIAKLERNGTNTRNLTPLDSSIDKDEKHLRVAYNLSKYENIAVRAPDAGDTSQNIAVRPGEPVHDSQNIPVRVRDDSALFPAYYDENIAVCTSPRKIIATQNSVKACTENIAEGVRGELPAPFFFQDAVEVNDLNKRASEMAEKFEGVEEVPAVWVPVIKHGLRYFPTTYNKLGISFIDVNYTDTEGYYTIYYSIFNKRGEFLFSQVYACKYKEGEDKFIKYYRKDFNEPVQPNMEFDFTEEDEVNEDEFYYALYRQYNMYGIRK